MNTTADKKPLWPQTPEGITDWDVVFDDPANGLIAIISKAKTPQSLKETTTLVIKKLFTRDDDAPEVSRFLAELDEIIGKVEENDQLAATIDAIAALLRTIKEERKEKAQEYLQKKKLGIAPEERRSRRKKNTLTSKIIRAILTASDPKIAIPLIVAMIAIVVGSVVYFASPPKVMPPPEIFTRAQPDPRPSSTETPKPGQEKEQSAPEGATQDAPAGDQAAAIVPEGEEDPMVSKWPKPVLVQPMHWPLIRENIKDPMVAYATIIYVNGSAGVSALCINYPATKESLLVAFGSIGIGNRQPDYAERQKIAAIATNLMNKRMGNFVDYIEIIPYGNEGYRATNTPPCRLAR
ncbi:MAG: hypothetical protein OEX17_04840 [Rhodospirillaceae bacterium]|nr:hypothetical protein [Rhodospirillaceae bacterium]